MCRVQRARDPPVGRGDQLGIVISSVNVADGSAPVLYLSMVYNTSYITRRDMHLLTNSQQI